MTTTAPAGDVLLVETDAVPDRAQSHNLDLIHAALENVERMGRMGTGDLLFRRCERWALISLASASALVN
jgi:hypothetical protein